MTVCRSCARKPAAFKSRQKNLCASALKTYSRALKTISGDVVFLDPPYNEMGEYEAALGALNQNPPGLVVAEHAARADLEPQYGSLERVRILRQGDSGLSFYRPR